VRQGEAGEGKVVRQGAVKKARPLLPESVTDRPPRSLFARAVFYAHPAVGDQHTQHREAGWCSESTERRKAVPACFARISSFGTMMEVDAASQFDPFGAGLESERLGLVCDLRSPAMVVSSVSVSGSRTRYKRVSELTWP
jgi:hypothetical protein